MARRGMTLFALQLTFWACLGTQVQSHAKPSSSLAFLQKKGSPIQKVVALIKDMKAQTEKEASSDLEAYDKYMCWCKTVKEEKTEAVKSAQAAIASLEAFIDEAAAKEGQLKTEIAGLEEDIAADTESLASAAGMRKKEADEFATEEADMKETRGLLEQAVSKLAKVQMLQKDGKATGAHVKAAFLQVQDMVRHAPHFQGVMQKDLFDLLGSMQGFLPKFDAAVFEQSAAPTGAAAGAKSYNSRSGGIVGLLKEMADKTAKDLASAQKEELEAVKSFESLKAAKTGEIKSGTEQKEAKQQDLANLLDKVAKAKEDAESTRGALTADEQVLLQASENCKVEEEEYAGRVKVRTEEIKALGETLNILTGDEARTLFSKTSLLELDSVSNAASARVQEASKASKSQAMQRLMSVAKTQKNWALASLALRVQLDSFEKVKKAMDKMTAELQAQQKAEVEKKEMCAKKIDETEDLIKVSTQTKKDLDAKHKDATNTIEVLTTEVTTLTDEVAEAEVSLKKAGEDRKAANELYQSSMHDQRATIEILHMASDRLKKFYTPESSLVEVRAHKVGDVAPPPPPKPQAYEKSASSGGVMQLLAKVIADAETTEAELKMDEQKSQEEYAAFVSATTASIEADRAAITEKKKLIASASADKSETEESQLANERELETLDKLLKATHLDCDYILKYFDVRQKARAEELDSIAEAKAILSGADFS